MWWEESLTLVYVHMINVICWDTHHCALNTHGHTYVCSMYWYAHIQMFMWKGFDQCVCFDCYLRFNVTFMRNSYMYMYSRTSQLRPPMGPVEVL